MRIFFILITAMIITSGSLFAQRDCGSTSYLQEQLSTNPLLEGNISRIESFIQQQLNSGLAQREQGHQVIRIPVVVHVLYHQSNENISDERIHNQILTLNESFRRRNSDTVNTPAIFKSIAADCEIEFQLAISDPQRRSTTGIIRKYTPIAQWQMNDEMKFSNMMGSDAWDPSSYLNIWVCNIKGVAGYSTWPGSDPSKDGLVINYKYLGNNSISGYEQGKTAVHEAGHWLGLKHIWGDENCGNDFVSDTPKQAFYNLGCPSGTRITCGNGPVGDMYMNYMDFTNDACINLFTLGQKARMRTMFEHGGERGTILSSTGLEEPLIQEMPLPEESPRWLYSRLYPNPASNEITLDVSYDVRWLGKTLLVTNTNGQQLMQVRLVNKIQSIDVSRLRPGVYFLTGKREDGEIIQFKFVKI
jgi:hypothetical protein